MDSVVVLRANVFAPLFRNKASDYMKTYNNVLPGFFFLRIFLSFCILFWHGFTICNGLEYDLFQNNYLGALGRMVLPMFFCLSGFLVTGSAVRTESLRAFLVFRLIRILPALAVEVTLSVFILGALATRRGLYYYFIDPSTYAYFGNVVGHLSFFLPDVFRHHPITMVNLNLWTLVPEYYCYLIMIVLFFFGIIKHRTWFLMYFIQGSVLFFVLNVYPAWQTSPLNEYLVMYCFFLGCLAFLYADYIPIHKALFLISAVLAYIGFYFEEAVLLGMVATAYCTIYLGMVRFPKIGFLESGDYSYGVYLYGFPITQIIFHYVPLFRTGFVLFGLSAPITLAFAAFSWHAVEKPALTLKRFFIPVKLNHGTQAL